MKFDWELRNGKHSGIYTKNWLLTHTVLITWLKQQLPLQPPTHFAHDKKKVLWITHVLQFLQQGIRNVTVFAKGRNERWKSSRPYFQRSDWKLWKLFHQPFRQWELEVCHKQQTGRCRWQPLQPFLVQILIQFWTPSVVHFHLPLAGGSSVTAATGQNKQRPNLRSHPGSSRTAGPALTCLPEATPSPKPRGRDTVKTTTTLNPSFSQFLGCFECVTKKNRIPTYEKKM